MDPLLLLFVLFVIKHFIFDYVLQFPYMIEQKGKYGAIGGTDHAALHGVGTFWVMLITPLTSFECLLLAIIDAVVHYHIDWVKQKLSQPYTPQDRKFWIWLGADQMAHYLTYIGILSIIRI